MNITSLERYFVSGDEKLFLVSFSKSSRMSFEKITEKAKKRRLTNLDAGYLGSSDEFDHVVVKWCDAYAKKIYKDFELYIKS